MVCPDLQSHCREPGECVCVRECVEVRGDITQCRAFQFSKITSHTQNSSITHPQIWICVFPISSKITSHTPTSPLTAPRSECVSFPQHPPPHSPARMHWGSSLSLLHPSPSAESGSGAVSPPTSQPPHKPSLAPRKDEADALSSTSPRPPASSWGNTHHQHFILLHGKCTFVSQTQRDFFVHLVGNRGPSRDPLPVFLHHTNTPRVQATRAASGWARRMHT